MGQPGWQTRMEMLMLPEYSKREAKDIRRRAELRGIHGLPLWGDMRV
jgi:hypothetical protein